MSAKKEKSNHAVDGYLSRVTHWEEESQKLRSILLGTDTGTATRIPPLFFGSQTTQNPGVEDCKMAAANSQSKGIG